MSNSDDGMRAMMDMWNQGQQAFLKAQKDVAEGFAKALSGNTMPGAPNMPGMNENVEAWQNFIKSWAPAWDPSKFQMAGGQAQPFNAGRDQLFAMFDSSNWLGHAPEQLREILQSIANAPRFADLATPQADAAEAWRETLDYQRAATDFATTLQGAWMRAFEEYSKNFSLEDLQNGDGSQALDAWLKAANKELLETQRSPEFMDAQRRLVRAATEIKARQRDMAEAWSEAYQIPTRTEVDDLTKIVQELRREVRKLRRDLAARD